MCAKDAKLLKPSRTGPTKESSGALRSGEDDSIAALFEAILELLKKLML